MIQIGDIGMISFTNWYTPMIHQLVFTNSYEPAPPQHHTTAPPHVVTVLYVSSKLCS